MYRVPSPSFSVTLVTINGGWGWESLGSLGTYRSPRSFPRLPESGGQSTNGVRWNSIGWCAVGTGSRVTGEQYPLKDCKSTRAFRDLSGV